MLDGTGICRQWQWVLLQDHPKNSAEEELGCSLPTSLCWGALPADKMGRMPPAASSVHAEMIPECTSFPCGA